MMPQFCLKCLLLFEISTQIAFSANGNKSPIYGILMQESDVALDTQELNGDMVNFLQAAGCRAVPILIDQKPEYYKLLFESLNGVIFPGGYNHVVDIDNQNFTSTGYFKVGKIFYDYAVEANNRGDYFPILGSCMGCQLLTYLASKQKLMCRCDAVHYATNLDFIGSTCAVKKSKLFRHASRYLIQNLAEKKISEQSHTHCLTPQNFSKANLGSFFHPISTNVDRQGLKFYSLLEAKEYPFYCSFIHPEGTLYATGPPCTDIPRTKDAIFATQYFSRFFANEARKSSHYFKDKNVEAQSLIFAFNATYTSNACVPIHYYMKIAQ